MASVMRRLQVSCSNSGTVAPESAPTVEQTTPFADECASFLAGTWCEEFDEGRPLPTWSWINQVAHADAATLRTIAEAVLEPSARPVDRVRAVLARAALAASDGALDLPALQHEVLVPIELSLMTGEAHSPRHVVELVTTALF